MSDRSERSTVFQCPFCDYSSGTKGSVAGHITRKIDDKHKGKSGPGMRDRINTVEYESDSDNSTNTDNTDTVADSVDSDESGDSVAAATDGGIVPEEYRIVESDESACCDDPSLEGSEGDMYRLESGTVVRLDEGDKICIECDAIHE